LIWRPDVSGVPVGVPPMTKGEKHDMTIGEWWGGNKKSSIWLWILRCTINRLWLSIKVVVCHRTNQPICNVGHPRFVQAKWYGSGCIR
jgi:hypothetical protein